MKRKGDATNPYPGPRPFRMTERELFFGRDSESRDLFSLITAHRAVMVYAQSGAGKTSLINAGLIPILIAEGFNVLSPARVGVLIPSGIRLEQLSNVFAFNTLTSWSAKKRGLARFGRSTLAGYLRGLRSDRKIHQRPRVAIFDQFEEIFTAYPRRRKDRASFFKQVSKALDADHLLRIVFVIREDYIAQLDPHTELLPEGLSVRFRLERLRKGAAILAVTEPLKGTQTTFARGVVERLVKDLLKERIFTGDRKSFEIVGEFVEPVQLQVVCQSLWNPAVSKITMKHLRDLGDIDRVLSRFYDEAIKEAAAKTNTDEGKLRNWCETELITSIGTRGTVYRERKVTMGIPNAAIDELDAKHLIRGEWRSGARWYELTHDRFIQPIQVSNKAYLLQQAEQMQQLRDLGEKTRRALVEQVRHSSDQAVAISKADMVLTPRGEDQHRTEKFQEALESLHQSLAIYQRLGDQTRIGATLADIAQIYGALEQYDEQAAAYTRLWELNREHWVIRRRAVAYWYAGRFNEAIADFTEAMKSHPNAFALLMARGQVFAEMGESQKAVTDLEQALRLSDESISLAYTRNGLALAYAGLGQYKRALSEFDKSIAAAPNNAWVYFNRAKCYEMMKEYKNAAEDYMRALEKSDPLLNPWRREQANMRLRQLSQVSSVKS